MLALTASLTASVAMAQTLTLDGAIAAALSANPDITAASAAEAEAREREVAARAGRLPTIEVQESWQRGNHPVFAFSSLLAQRRFTESGFALQTLNRPDAIDHHRLAITARQPLFDGGAVRAATTTARVATALAAEAGRDGAAGIAAAVTQAYAQALTADARTRSAAGAVEAAAEDLARTRARHDEEQVTDADVLAFEMHLAEMRARHLEAVTDGVIARATLNRLMDVDLGRAWDLVDPAPIDAAPANVAALEPAALLARTDTATARLWIDMATAALDTARAARLPRVAVEGGYEWNGGAWADRASAWAVGITAGWSLALGGAESANARAAARAVDRARAELASAESAARLDVRAAAARVETAGARLALARTVVLQARERARIVRDRYEAGLSGITDLLRATSAVLDAETLDAEARGNTLVAAVQLDRALGRVPGAESLK